MQQRHQHRVEKLTLAFGCLLIALSPAAAPESTDAQRAAFRAAYLLAERGEWEAAAAAQDLLNDYVLWPDLRAAYLRVHLDDDDAVQRFLNRYGTLKPARELRYRYALRLAAERRHDDFLGLYETHYLRLGEPTLDCLAAHALMQLDRAEDARALAEDLWLVGRSQVKQCDRVFDGMRSRGMLTGDLLRRRYALAIAERDFMLARYLARSVDDAHLDDANRWLRSRGDPERFLRQADPRNTDEVYRQQLAYAAERIAYSDPVRALAHWERLGRSMAFGPELDARVTRHAALWAARLNLGGARDLLDGLADAAIDTEVRRWQIRSALREHDWPRVLDVIGTLDPPERRRQEWRYWRAVALQQSGAAAEAMLALGGLAQERSYYGFLAADQLGLDYPLAESAAEADEAAIARLAALPALIRAGELYRVGLDGRARSEWDAAVRVLGADDKAQAALLAHRWDWHSRAISVAAQSGRFDDLDLRYPLPHREAFRASSEAAGVRESWAYGVARSESLFMRDVRSSAGAIGLMQLMPSTGRSTAREIKHPYKGRSTLVDAASNIRLGTTYLGKMNDRFDRHPALATAAYNAGPMRVSGWLPGSGPMDARIWVETIPYNETRSYVRRVLASDVIFEWRLTGQVTRLSSQLPEIPPTSDSAASPGH